MDLIFQPTRGKPFSIEIGYFDTVLEIKEKIQKKRNIPVSRQILLFNGAILNDELNIHDSTILDRSRIKLILSPEPDEVTVKKSSSPPPKKTHHLIVKLPNSKSTVAVEMDADDTIRKLKEKIYKIRGNEGVPIELLSVHANGIELLDHRTIDECELSDRSEIEVNVRPSSTVSTGSLEKTAGVMTGKKLKIQVATSGGGRKIPIEMNFSDNVGELKKELQRLNQILHLNLPEEGYFFIYKQSVMDDDRSFRWHHVGQGETIEIFSGSISGGL